MRTTTYYVEPQTEAFAAKAGIGKIFESVTHVGLADENSHDRCWQKLEAEGPQEQYERLDTQDMALLLEGHIANILEDILWGHKFVVNVRMHKNGSIYEVNVWIELIREVNDRWKYSY